MSGKSEKKLRRTVYKEYIDKAEELQKKAVNNWLGNLLRCPFKVRVKVAWTILRGSKERKHGRTKKNRGTNQENK